MKTVGNELPRIAVPVGIRLQNYSGKDGFSILLKGIE